MARAASTSTISPTTMGLGAPVVADAIQATIEQLNWSYANRPTVHWAWCASGDDLGSPSICPILFSVFLDDEVERLRTSIYINPDTQSLLVGVRVNMAASTLGSVKVDVGATSHTFSGLTDGSTAEQTVSLSTDDTSIGWQDVIVSLISSFGPTTDCRLISVRVQDELIDINPCNVTDEGILVTDDGERVTDCGDEH